MVVAARKLLFADDPVLLAPPERFLEVFAAECYVAGMRMNLSVMKNPYAFPYSTPCAVQINGEAVEQVERFTNDSDDGKLEEEIDRRTGMANGHRSR
ncbi:unnamed protein product [Soboliphyme baturini]|uniref:ABC transporter ATP-binding protein n=1 Tax=Soboliphyme baturini TaxID=241478 RepID=A0A183IH35_9BILA|nr:unnamed protein product [Soboliphyme baturini]